MKLIFYYKFRFYTSKLNEICLHCHWLYFSSIIMSFGQGDQNHHLLLVDSLHNKHHAYCQPSKHQDSSVSLSSSDHLFISPTLHLFFYSPLPSFISSSLHLFTSSSLCLFISLSLHLFHLFTSPSLHLFFSSSLHLFIFLTQKQYKAWDKARIKQIYERFSSLYLLEKNIKNPTYTICPLL